MLLKMSVITGTHVRPNTHSLEWVLRHNALDQSNKKFLRRLKAAPSFIIYAGPHPVRSPSSTVVQASMRVIKGKSGLFKARTDVGTRDHGRLQRLPAFG